MKSQHFGDTYATALFPQRKGWQRRDTEGWAKGGRGEAEKERVQE